MALQPQDRPAGSTQVLRFVGTVVAGVALGTFPKANGEFTTGGAAGDMRGVRFLLGDATDLSLSLRRFPADAFDDTQPAATAPHAPSPTGASALIVNGGELSIGTRTWCQNTHVTVKNLGTVLGSVDTENARMLVDTATSGLGLNTGLPVLVLPVALLGSAVAPFDIDLLVEIRWAAHR